MAILTVPKVLREKLGDEGVEAARHERDNLLISWPSDLSGG